MDWDNARVTKQETNRYHRWIKEAIEIRKWSPKTMNRVEGASTLSHTWGAVDGRPPWRAVLGGGGLTAGGVVHQSEN